MPLSGLACGVFCSAAGARTTLWLSAVGASLPPAWLLLSPLRRMGNVRPSRHKMKRSDNRNRGSAQPLSAERAVMPPGACGIYWTEPAHCLSRLEGDVRLWSAAARSGTWGR